MKFYKSLIIVFVVGIVTPLMDAHLPASRELLNRLPSWNDFNLLKRDVCTNAIPGTVSETCAPGNTLCCEYNNRPPIKILSIANVFPGVPSTNTGAASTFPQCQKVTGIGACCVSETSCYIDTTSDCSATGAVQCSK